MSWARLDDGFPDHRKVEGLSAEAFRSFVKAVCYCARNLTDGVLPVSSFAYLGRKRYLDELQAAGLFDAVGDGRLSVHDYLEWNPSREKVLADRAATAARVARLRNGRSNGVTNAVTNGSPVPVPDPIPNPTDSVTKVPRTREAKRIFKDEDRAQMRERYSPVASLAEIDEQIDLALAHRALKNTNRQDLYVNNWLRRSFERRGNGTSTGRGQPAGSRGYAGNGRGPVGIVRPGGNPVVGAFPVAKKWPPASNE